MAKRKRAARPSGIVDRAVSAGRRALREAEKRVPPDLRRQVERRLKDADKTARAAIKQLQAQARKASTRADVNSVLKRIDGLTKQARQIAQGTSPRRSVAPARRPATRKTTRTATRTRKATTTPTRKAAPARKAAAPRAAAPKTATQRRRRAAARRSEGEVMVVPVEEMGEIEIIEVTPEP